MTTGRVRSIATHLPRLVRVGYVRGLVAFDVLVVLLILRAWNRPVDPSQLDWVAGLVGLAFMTLICPMLVAIVRVVFGSRVPDRGPMTRRATGMWLVPHACASGLFVAWALTSSHHGGGAWQWTLYGVAGIVPLGWALTLSHDVRGRTAIAPAWMKLALADLRLLDLGDDLYPADYSPKRHYLAAGAISPGTALGQRISRRLVREYNRKGPGTTEGLRHLSRIAGECAAIIETHLLINRGAAPVDIAFTTSTSRALELAVRRFRARHIVVSPFEHPSEIRVLEYVAAEQPGSVHVIKPKEAWLRAAPNTPAFNDAVTAMIEALRPLERQPGTVLIVSEVCWATGVRLPLASLLAEIRRALPGSRHTVVVDGAHAVCNNGLIDVSLPFDAYLFGGHKWMFSNEPVGVVLTREPWPEPCPVDLWVRGPESFQPPISTAGPRLLTNLRGALEIHTHARRYDELWERSADLRRRVIDGLRDRFDIAGLGDRTGEQGHSFIVSAEPKPGYAWKATCAGALKAHFEQAEIPVTLAEIEQGRSIFVRTTLPYFLGRRDVAAVLAAFASAIEPRSTQSYTRDA